MTRAYRLGAGRQEPRRQLYDEEVLPDRCTFWLLALGSAPMLAQVYSAPAGIRPASKQPAAAILPGGRVIAAYGEQYLTGAGPFGLALSPNANTLVTANLGPGVASLTALERVRMWQARELLAAPPEKDWDPARDDAWRSVSFGIVFSGERTVLVSEGGSGRIAAIDLANGERRRAIDLNQNEYRNSYTGKLVLDRERGIVYVADLANLRVVAIDTRSRQILASVELGGPPFSLALSLDRRKLYVTVASLFPSLRLGAGLVFPAFGFPGLPQGGAGFNPRGGQTNGPPPEDSVCGIDVANPATPRTTGCVHTGLPLDVVATAEKIYVSNATNDSITILDSQTNHVEREIPIRIPNLSGLRGIVPAGLALDETTGWLLVAEAGINAVGVVNTHSGEMLGHIPAGWFPTHVLVEHKTVFVENQLGGGTGPNAFQTPYGVRVANRELRRGSVSIYSLPEAAALPSLTEIVMRNCGFRPSPAPPRLAPMGIAHVVLIVKGSRTFDEVLGDVTHTAGAPVMAAPPLARFGRDGYADGHAKRLSLHHVNITPNLHTIAERWSLSDNFYAAEMPFWPEVPATEAILAQRGISFYHFTPDGLSAAASDTERASRFIHEIDERFGKPGRDLPTLVSLNLPNDSFSQPDPEHGYPYAESFAADNDLALGRVVEYLSASKWWRSMVILIVGDAAGTGFEHVDTHRTVLLCAGPWAKKQYVTHRNTGFPGLLKTILEILNKPKLSLFDASATSVDDCLTAQPDFATYQAVPVDSRLYAPAPSPQ